MAIALALLDPQRTDIYTDSRSAARAFASGTVCKEVFRTLANKELTQHTITWFPAHLGSKVGGLSNVNELAHSQARGLTCRAGTCAAQPEESAPSLHFRDILSTFNEVTKHYQMGRRRFPLQHEKLSRPQAVSLRMLQTGTYPSLSSSSHYTDSSPLCPDCNARSDFIHMLWRCPSLQERYNDFSEEEFYSFIKSPDLLPQIKAVQKAHDAAVRLGLPVPTWERPAILLF